DAGGGGADRRADPAEPGHPLHHAAPPARAGPDRRARRPGGRGRPGRAPPPLSPDRLRAERGPARARAPGRSRPPRPARRPGRGEAGMTTKRERTAAPSRAERAYAALLWLYPGAFREEYGGEMCAAFGARWAEARRTGGSFEPARLALAV